MTNFYAIDASDSVSDGFYYDRMKTLSVGSVSKSSSINSNECLTGSMNEPLKLVFKRQSNGKYAVKNNDLEENNGQLNSEQRRPKRQASRKVKFVFSDEENENIDEAIVKQKRVKKSIAPLIDTNALHMFYNNQPQQYCGNVILPPYNIQQFTEKKTAKNQVKPKKKAKPIAKKVPIAQQTRPEQVISKITEARPLIKPYKHSDIFNENDLVKISSTEKTSILDSQPIVLLDHSLPLHIALVEDKTNIVCTKAVLFIHLFRSFNSPCIGCPLCKTFLTTTEFSKHIHPDEEEDEEEDDEDEYPRKINEENSKKSYKILPYNQNKFTETDLVTWKTFSKRFATFKQKQLAMLEQKNSDTTRITDKFLVTACKTANEKAENSLANLNKIEFDDWDYKENERFLINQDRIESDQIYEVKHDENNNQVCAKQVHYFYEQEEDLLLSEDEDENCNKTELPISPNKILKKKTPTLDERYINMYENLPHKTLLYLCENEFTIIPLSFVMYLNNQKESNRKQIKLAETSYFKTKWLELSLDLESSKKLNKTNMFK